MMRRREFVGSLALLPLALLPLAPAALADAPDPDLRNIKTGSPIPKEGYVDQPYVVITNDGNWLCVLTTGSGVEGEPDSTSSPRSAATRAEPGRR